MATTIAQLEKKWSNDKDNLGEILKTTSQTLSTQLTAFEERASRAENDLSKEREWRISLQENELQLKEKIITLDNYIKELDDKLKSSKNLKDELDKVRNQWSEAQTTLEELGIQLSESKLKLSEFQEKDKRRREDLLHHSISSSSLISENDGQSPMATATPGIWAPDSITTHCTTCQREFNLTRRKHHCRSCGEIFCGACSKHTLPLRNENGMIGKPVRVCLACFASHK